MRAPAMMFTVVMLATVHAGAQEPRPGREGFWIVFAGLPADPQDDPAYAAYRKGYGYVIEERWAEARKTMEELQKRFPRSPYVDDAAYWSAYALGQTDRTRAITAYERFLERYPRSKYFEDASTDYAALRAIEAPGISLDSMVVRFRLHEAPQIRVIHEHGVRSLEVAVRRMNRGLRFGTSAGVITLTERPFESQEHLDHATKLKIESLSALGEIRGDEEAFRTLREMARDPRQPPLFRVVALRSLSQFSKFDPLPVLVDAARNDTSRIVQETAILCIGQVPGEREKAMESLAGLYARLPQADDQRRLAVIDAAASLGTTGALTFLVEVARTAPDVELQTTAIDNITVAGRDKQRTVEHLIDLYHSLPPERKQARETALYCVAEMGTDHAVDFLVEVARDGSDYDLRRDAVIYLGTIGGTKARNALYGILRSP